jgi:hypothetical protein
MSSCHHFCHAGIQIVALSATHKSKLVTLIGELRREAKFVKSANSNGFETKFEIQKTHLLSSNDPTPNHKNIKTIHIATFFPIRMFFFLP